ncbi:hypothetical protein C8A00DRAFT_32548 [Chaetomidium leptoderma]|uniref:Uncharacterized protein n=1 Tax=Chaetomidium leptoderma TaxID=669021 RepID=A0AAN6ZWL0_9PEZI|nr:hypothetical protein C8A00DRAFT_32548 [Chaetomidium leptoderma]
MAPSAPTRPRLTLKGLPRKRPGPAPKPLSERLKNRPPKQVKRVERSYTRERKIEVLVYLLNHQVRVLDDRLRRVPRRRVGQPHESNELAEPVVQEENGEFVWYRAPTYAEASDFWKIPTPTIQGWWDSRKKLLEGTGIELPQVDPVGFSATPAATGASRVPNRAQSTSSTTGGEVQQVQQRDGVPVADSTTAPATPSGPAPSPNPGHTQNPPASTDRTPLATVGGSSSANATHHYTGLTALTALTVHMGVKHHPSRSPTWGLPATPAHMLRQALPAIHVSSPTPSLKLATPGVYWRQLDTSPGEESRSTFTSAPSPSQQPAMTPATPQQVPPGANAPGTTTPAVAPDGNSPGQEEQEGERTDAPAPDDQGSSSPSAEDVSQNQGKGAAAAGSASPSDGTGAASATSRGEESAVTPMDVTTAVPEDEDTATPMEMTGSPDQDMAVTPIETEGDTTTPTEEESGTAEVAVETPAEPAATETLAEDTATPMEIDTEAPADPAVDTPGLLVLMR